MLNEEVRKVMTTDPITVSPNDTIRQISDLMVNRRFQQIPVTEDGKLVGMVTAYDLWRALRDAKSEERPVKDIMTTNVVRITPKDKLGTAAELFMDRRFKTLPVVNLENKLKGVITAFDVIRHTLKEEYPTPILYDEIINRE